MVGTKEGENNQTGNPTVNPGRDNVAIYGAPTFPMGGKRQGFPSGRELGLVNPRKVAIENEKETDAS